MYLFLYLNFYIFIFYIYPSPPPEYKTDLYELNSKAVTAVECQCCTEIWDLAKKFLC